jgi:hypothetical protein
MYGTNFGENMLYHELYKTNLTKFIPLHSYKFVLSFVAQSAAQFPPKFRTSI